jgi:hypothetical protein
MSNRREYRTEWTLGVTVMGAIIERQQDLAKIDVPNVTDVRCNLYLVTRAPRLSIEIYSPATPFEAGLRPRKPRTSVHGTVPLLGRISFDSLPILPTGSCGF